MAHLKFKKLHENALLPSRSSENSCGLDISSVESLILKTGERKAVRTGLSVEIPMGYYGRVAPRSGIALRYGIDTLAGVIDSDYRGEILCLLINLGEDEFTINVGERIAQLIIEKVAILKPKWDENLTKTERQSKGFGSSGK